MIPRRYEALSEGRTHGASYALDIVDECELKRDHHLVRSH